MRVGPLCMKTCFKKLNAASMFGIGPTPNILFKSVVTIDDINMIFALFTFVRIKFTNYVARYIFLSFVLIF